MTGVQTCALPISDIPSIAISTDRVDEASVATAQRWDVAEVRRFMIVFGLVSTGFDLLTFALLLLVFVIQNTQVVELRFLLWKVEMSRALMLLGMLIAGFGSGWLAGSARHPPPHPPRR